MGNERRFHTKMEIALFRLIQEAVQNSCKHADPKNISVKIEFTDRKVSLFIKDDGKGFDAQGQQKPIRLD